MSDSFLTKLKNKVSYQLNSAVDDPEAKAYAEKQKEEQEAAPPPAEEAPKEEPEEPDADTAAGRIVQKMVRYTKRAIREGFYPVLILFMASLVANEMIVYPPEVRLAFFVFTVIVCVVMKPVVFLLGFYFLCKKGYDYYINEMVWEEGMPKRIIMTTLFAFLPLTTNESEGRIKNFFMKPFQYGGKFSKKDGEELEKRMEMYKEDLRESFPFLEKIKTREPYEAQLVKIEGRFNALHEFTETPPANPPPMTNESGLYAPQAAPQAAPVPATTPPVPVMLYAPQAVPQAAT